jgi:hypothetical protein
LWRFRHDSGLGGPKFFSLVCLISTETQSKSSSLQTHHFFQSNRAGSIHRTGIRLCSLLKRSFSAQQTAKPNSDRALTLNASDTK